MLLCMKHTVVGNILRAIGWLQICHFGFLKSVLFSATRGGKKKEKKKEGPDKTFCRNVNADVSKKAGEV